jgi:hypothetical protein
MVAEITRNLRGDLTDPDGQQSIRDFLNNANEQVWIAILQTQIAKLYGQDSPVSFALATNTERLQLVSIQDPTEYQVSVANIAGGALANRFYDFYFTLCTESGSETLASAGLLDYNVPANNLAQVTGPDPGIVGQAFGWNLYVGTYNGVEQEKNWALQNQQPLPFNVVYNEPPTGFQGYPTNQQTLPIKNNTADNISYIKQLEIRTSDQLLRSWDQYELGSETFRRMGRIFPSASEYASYVWDLTGNGTLEFRPMTGAAFEPRYWYIAKPRRLRYDRAELIYNGIIGVHDYMYNYTMLNCKMILDEYIATDKFQVAADKALIKMQLALLEESWSKNQRISPYLF